MSSIMQYSVALLGTRKCDPRRPEVSKNGISSGASRENFYVVK